MNDVFAVIMAVLVGTRFSARVACELRPKQLLPLAGESGLVAPRRDGPSHRAARATRKNVLHRDGGRTWLEATAREAAATSPRANVLAEPVAAQHGAVHRVGQPPPSRASNPTPSLMLLPSDHFITDEDGFRACPRTDDCTLRVAGT